MISAAEAGIFCLSLERGICVACQPDDDFNALFRRDVLDFNEPVLMRLGDHFSEFCVAIYLTLSHVWGTGFIQYLNDSRQQVN